MAKKYFWLKLKDDFFNQKEIKMLRKLAGGDTFTIIYLKILLLSLKNDGRVYYDGIAKNMIEEIALEIDEQIDNVTITFNYLQSKGLLVFNADDEVELSNVHQMIGSESASASRVRKHRMNKALQSNGEVTKMKHLSNTEIEKEIEIELDIDKEKEIESKNKPASKKPLARHKYGEYKNVLLTDEQLTKLKQEFPNDWEQQIDNVSNYCESTGKSYKNYYATIKSWAKKDNEKRQKPKMANAKTSEYDNLF